MRSRFTMTIFLGAALAAAACTPEGSDEWVRLTHVGIAHLENRESQPALQAFTAALELAPDSPPTLRNLARAQLLARAPEAAAELLGRAARLEPESAATSYLAGLAASHQASFEDARRHFEDAVRLDPRTPALRFQLANALQSTGHHPEAIRQFEETLRLDPLHTSAVYKLLSYARQAGDPDQVDKWNRELVRLRGLLGEEGRNAEAQEKCIYTLAEVPPSRREADPLPPAAVFRGATEELLPETIRPATSAAVVEVDDEGRPVLFAAGDDGGLVLTPGGEVRALPTAEGLSGKLRVTVGDFFDRPVEGPFDPLRHAGNDVLVLGPDGARLLLRELSGDWTDVTAEARLGGVGGRRARWVDAEHDGDLDLVVVSDDGLTLWQNNGDATFTDITTAAGLAGTGPAVDVAAADLDGDVAVDLVVARGELPTLVYLNRRTGSFAPRPDPPGPWPPARRVLVDDLDHDGWADAVLVGDEVVIVPGAGGRRERLPASGLEATTAALVDVDNDGWRDLVIAGRTADTPPRGGLRLWRNEGAGEWLDAGAAAGLDAAEPPPVLDVVAADLDGDGDSDLLLETTDGLAAWRNDGGNENAQLKVRLVGTKTNASGLGARLEAVRGDLRLHRVVDSLPVEIGLGGPEPLDVLRVVWTNGIVDNSLDVEVGQAPFVLKEKNVAAGSCPFLYAWDGEAFRFVTDVLGNSPLGLSIARGVPLDADPDELVEIGSGSALAAEDGRYKLVVTEEMREVLYLDEARLVAVDHPPEVEVHATDKLMPAPFPPSELWLLADLRPPREVLADDGVDRTAAVRERDGVFAPPGTPLPPPLRGMTRPLALTLDFGPLDPSRPLVLALTGWLQYGDASTNIALSQGAAEVVAPRLEAETSPGGWVPVDVVVGVPAGKTKTILVDLRGKLPAGSRRLRLTTTFEIHWDRIALGERRPDQDGVRTVVSPLSAELFERGFSEIRSRVQGHPTTPDYAAVSPTPPWRTALQGWLTRTGDVLELVRERDERLALVGAGDALEFTFDAAAFPALPPGRERTFFFYSVGWDKDGDLNVIDGTTVEPLPVQAPGDWQERYNTRWVPKDRFQP